jgi:CheY-like chemotaxis protein
MSAALAPVLIVDDLDENLIALEALLRSDTVTILKARSGREALELLLRHEVALALIDVQMPDMDGFELAELLHGNVRTKGIPIIFLTAASDAQRRYKGYEAPTFSGARWACSSNFTGNARRSSASATNSGWRRGKRASTQPH